MKLIIVLSAILLAINAYPNFHNYIKFIKFKAKHDKFYPAFENMQRAKIFNQNLAKIKLHNKRYAQGLETYTMAVNQFADLTHEELNTYRSYKQSSFPSETFVSNTDYDYNLPDSMDWRKEGAVTPVKDQGQCGSCWAFSATGALEGLNFLTTGQLVSFSEQELIDCSIYFNNFGCKKGSILNAFTYVILNGITTEEEYPYEAKNGTTCNKQPEHNQNIISSFGKVKSFDEDELKNAVATIGPISVAVDASNDWFLYNDGVYSNGECKNTEGDLNHGVLVVGYGSEDKLDYWLIKNSWGETFGKNGYIRIARNQDNTCGVATDAVYPIR